MSLGVGQNTIRITATDRAGSRSELVLTVVRQPLQPLPPLIVSLVLDDAKMGSTSFKVMHYGGTMLPDAFATENLYKMDVRINGKPVTTMAGVTFKLNGGP